MKKSLVALAVAAALPAFAQAQTNVQLTGSVDGALESVNADANGVSDLKVTNGVWSGSRLSVVGTEELGGGLKGLFWIEHRFAVDDGTITGTTGQVVGATAGTPAFWAGQAWVGLGGGFGTVRFGRQYTPIFRSFAIADTTGYSWYNNAAGPQGLSGTAPGFFTNRFNNYLSYESPKLGGFTIHGGYAAGESYAPGAGVDLDKRGDTWGLSGVGAVGPISVGLGYQTSDSGSAAEDRTEFAGSLGAKFGAVGLGLGYAVVETAGATAGSKLKQKGAFASASLGIGAGTVYLTYARVDPDGDDNVNNGIGLTYSHGLSKRTFVYAALGYNKIETTGDDVKPRKIAIGVRHFF